MTSFAVASEMCLIMTSFAVRIDMCQFMTSFLAKGQMCWFITSSALRGQKGWFKTSFDLKSGIFSTSWTCLSFQLKSLDLLSSLFSKVMYFLTMFDKT